MSLNEELDQTSTQSPSKDELFSIHSSCIPQQGLPQSAPQRCASDLLLISSHLASSVL